MFTSNVEANLLRCRQGRPCCATVPPLPVVFRVLHTPLRWLNSALLAALLLLLSAQAQATLSLEQALALAQQRSRQLVAQDALASSSQQMAMAASQLPDPTFKLGINNLPVTGPDRYSVTSDFMTMRSVGIAQEFTRAEKRKVRATRFDREGEVAQAGRVALLANLRRDTAMAWLERHYLERMLDFLKTQRDETSLQIDAADAAYRSGRGTQADVFAARSAVAVVDDRMRQTERQVTVAKTRLARWVGEAAGQTLAAPPSLTAVRLHAQGLEDKLAHHPQIALMQTQEAVARAEVDIAQAGKQADWSLELMYSQRGSAYSNMISLNASVPLQWDQKNRQDREVAAKLLIAEQMQAQREEALREHVAETQTWLQEWQGNQQRLAHYDSTLIPLATERTRAALAGYRGGGGGSSALAAVLEARRMEIDVRMDRLRVEMETATRWAQLEYLLPPEPEASAKDPMAITPPSKRATEPSQ